MGNGDLLPALSGKGYHLAAHQVLPKVYHQLSRRSLYQFQGRHQLVGHNRLAGLRSKVVVAIVGHLHALPGRSVESGRAPTFLRLAGIEGLAIVDGAVQHAAGGALPAVIGYNDILRTIFIGNHNLPQQGHAVAAVVIFERLLVGPAHVAQIPAAGQFGTHDILALAQQLGNVIRLIHKMMVIAGIAGGHIAYAQFLAVDKSLVHAVGGEIGDGTLDALFDFEAAAHKRRGLRHRGSNPAGLPLFFGQACFERRLLAPAAGLAGSIPDTHLPCVAGGRFQGGSGIFHCDGVVAGDLAGAPHRAAVYVIYFYLVCTLTVVLPVAECNPTECRRAHYCRGRGHVVNFRGDYINFSRCGNRRRQKRQGEDFFHHICVNYPFLYV